MGDDETSVELRREPASLGRPSDRSYALHQHCRFRDLRSASALQLTQDGALRLSPVVLGPGPMSQIMAKRHGQKEHHNLMHGDIVGIDSFLPCLQAIKPQASIGSPDDCAYLPNMRGQIAASSQSENMPKGKPLCGGARRSTISITMCTRRRRSGARSSIPCRCHGVTSM
jgi:hypothetical protein